MKTLLNIETWGIRLYFVEQIDIDLLAEYRNFSGPGYLVEYDNTYAPITDTVKYGTLEEALGDIVNYLMDPDNICDMEGQPEYFQRAYKLAGVQLGTNPVHPEISETVGTFLYYILDGIIQGNL
jgi:hypothetical protein